MSKYNHTVTFPLVALTLTLLVSLFLLAACGTGADSLIQTTPTTENTTVTNMAVFPTPSPSPTLTADPTSVNQLIASFTTAGAAVVNYGHTEQGLFPAKASASGISPSTIPPSTFTNSAIRTPARLSAATSRLEGMSSPSLKVTRRWQLLGMVKGFPTFGRWTI